MRGDAGRSERLIAGYLERLTEQRGVQPLRGRALSAARRRPARLSTSGWRCARPGAARGEVIGEVTVVAPAGAGRPHRPESRLARARPLGRAAARPVLRPDRARRPHHARRLHAPPTSTSSRRSRSATISGSAARASPSARQLTYAWASPDLDLPGVDIELAHPVRDASRRAIRSSAARRRDPARRDRPRHHRPGHRLQRHPAQPRPAARRLRAAGVRRARPRRPAIRATRRPSRVWRLGGSAEVRQGLDMFGASDGCGPGLVACLAPGAVPPTRLEGDPDRDRACAAASMANIRPMPRLTFAARPARPVQRAIPCSASRNFRPAITRSGAATIPAPCSATAASALQAELRYGSAISAPRPTEFAVEPYVFFDHAWVWNEDRLFAARPPGAELGRRRRARRLWRPLPLDVLRRRAARPPALPDRARRHPLARLAHHPPVAMEIKMTMSAPLPARRARAAPGLADRLRGRRPLPRRRRSAAPRRSTAMPTTVAGIVSYDRATPGRRDGHGRIPTPRSSTGTPTATRSSSCPPAIPRPSSTAPTTPISSSSTGSSRPRRSASTAPSSASS